MADARHARGRRGAGTDGRGGCGQPAGVEPDSIETVDDIVAVVGDTAILYSEIIESIVQAGAQGEEMPEPGTAEFDSLARETLTNLVDSRILLQKAKESDIQVHAGAAGRGDRPSVPGDTQLVPHGNRLSRTR